MFGKDITETFHHINNTHCIIRAHQVVEDGYNWSHDKGVMTVFSAPNYCYRMKNLGAAVHIFDNYDSKCVQFEASTKASEIPLPVIPDRYFD